MNLDQEFTTTCRNCGETREYDPHGGNPSPYCSIECYEDYTTEVECGHCGKENRQHLGTIRSGGRCWNCNNRYRDVGYQLTDDDQEEDDE